MNKNPTIIRSTVTQRPHRPALVNEILRRDAVNWDAPVIQAMAQQAEPDPLTGPRTGTHPMAVPISREMATRVRPHLYDPKPDPIYCRPVFWGAMDLLVIAAGVALAWWLA